VKRTETAVSEIADLLSYVLKREIPVMVLKTWTNHDCYLVERWCEQQLINSGLLPKPVRKKHAGRLPDLSMPQVVEGLVVVGKAKAAGNSS
jgi:hypothetical protein